MRARVCSAGHDVVLHVNPNTVGIRKLMSDTNHKFAVVVNGSKLIHEGDSFAKAEQCLVNQCAAVHGRTEGQHGRFRIGRHRLVSGMVRHHSEKDIDRPPIKPVRTKAIINSDVQVKR